MEDVGCGSYAHIKRRAEYRADWKTTVDQSAHRLRNKIYLFKFSYLHNTVRFGLRNFSTIGYNRGRNNNSKGLIIKVDLLIENSTLLFKVITTGIQWQGRATE